MSTPLIASPEAILAQIDLLTASVKDLRKATAAAFKQHKTAVAATAKAGSKKAKKASGSDSSSVSSGGSRTNTNSWQGWTAYVLPAKGESGTERAERYTEFKEAYTHPVNGTKQGVMIAYLGHRAYIGGSKEGGQTPEYAAFLSAFAERKAATATATATSVVSIVKSKKPVAAAILDLDDSHSVASTEEREASLGTAIIPMTPSSNSSASLPPPPAKGKKASATPAKCPTVKVLQLTDGPAVAAAGKKKTLPAPPASLARIETIPESSSNSASNSSAVATAKPVVKTVAKKGKKAAPALLVSAAAVPVNPRATMAPWEFNGTTYLKNDTGHVWSAEGEWCGVFNESEDLIDETVDEPVWPPVAEDVA